MSLSVLTPDELEAVSHWSIGKLENATLPHDGSVNRTVLFETSRGSYALRTCRKTKQVVDLQKECAVIQHVAQEGLPALTPVLLPDGLPYLNLKQQLYILFPKATGRQVARAALAAKQLQAMGECLARLTLALEDYPENGIFRRTFEFDANKTLMRLDELEQCISHFPSSGPDEKAALAQIRQRRRFLETHRPTASLENLHFQVSHGDFHDGNLFFDEGKVSSIIDWDQIRVTPRYFELLRCAHFLLSELELKKVRRFVRAFRENYPINTNELGATITLYNAERAYNLWTLETIYFEGNDRARVFLRGKFAETFKAFELMEAQIHRAIF